MFDKIRKLFSRKESQQQTQVSYVPTNEIQYQQYPTYDMYMYQQYYTAQPTQQQYYVLTPPPQQAQVQQPQPYQVVYPQPQPYSQEQLYQYYQEYVNKARTGVEYLDRLLRGGLRRGEIYLIAGEAGMGKTIFSLQFLKTGADDGEVGIYISVDEPSEDVKRGVKESIGWDFERYERDGKLIMLDFKTHFRVYAREEKVVIDPRDLAESIINYVKKYDAKRLVIDPIAPLVITSHQDILWIREYLRELVFQLRKLKDVTTILTSEIPTGEDKISRFGVEEYLASGVITLSIQEYEGKIFRVMFIRKMRWTPIRPIKLVFEIQEHKGIVIKGSLEDFIRRIKQGYYEEEHYPQQYQQPYYQVWGYR